jgi:hypothetical protein
VTILLEAADLHIHQDLAHCPDAEEEVDQECHLIQTEMKHRTKHPESEPIYTRAL